MTMQTVALVGAAVLMLLLLVVYRRRRAAAEAGPAGAGRARSVERSAPLPPVALAAAESAERMTHMGPPAPEPMDWPPFGPDREDEEDASSREPGAMDPPHRSEDRDGAESDSALGEVAVVEVHEPTEARDPAPEPVTSAAPYASAYPEGVVVTEPGWPMPGELDMGDWQPAAPTALGAAAAAAAPGSSVEAAPTPAEPPEGEVIGGAIGSFEPEADAVGAFDPAAGWSQDDDAAPTTAMGTDVAEPAGPPEAGVAEPAGSPGEAWGSEGAWEPEEETWEPAVEEAGGILADEAPRAWEAAEGEPGTLAEWPAPAEEDVEIQIVPTIDDDDEPVAMPQSPFAWAEPGAMADAPEDLVIPGFAEEDPETPVEPPEDDGSIEGPAPEHFAPMDGPAMWRPADPAPEPSAPEALTGRFALGGFALGPGQEALANVRFREALPAAPEPSDIELIADGALNCRADDVVVLVDAGVAPTPEGFTVRVASLAPGPFAASGTFRVI